MLEKEKQYFESKRNEFKKKYPGKYVVIIGDKLIGFYDTDQAAYEAGVSAKGNVPMLVKFVDPEDGDETFSAPSLFLGLIHGVK